MRRLEHLACVKCVEIGVIVCQPMRRFLENLGHCGWVLVGLKGRQCSEFRLKQFCGAGEQAGYWIFEHGDLSHYHSHPAYCA